MSISMNAFVDFWVEEKKKRILPHYSLGAIEFFKKIKQIPDFKSDGVLSTPNEIIDLLKHASKHRNDLVRFADYNVDFSPASMRDKQECIDDLQHLSSVVDSIYFSEGMEYILVKKQIEMYNPYQDVKFDFGNFKIRMHDTSVIVEACGNNTKRDGYFHPYVKSSKLCLGEYKKSYSLFYSNMRYYDAWLEVYKCLTTYGGDALNGGKAGPEHAMNAWIGFQCDVCKATNLQAEDTVSCVKSRSLICRDCVNTGTCTDEVSREYYLPGFIKKCDSCGKNASTVTNGRCLSCRMN